MEYFTLSISLHVVHLALREREIVLLMRAVTCVQIAGDSILSGAEDTQLSKAGVL